MPKLDVYKLDANKFDGGGGEYGTAGGAQTLQGYTVGTENGVVPGEIAVKGVATYTPSGSTQNGTAGYYSGVTVNPIPSTYKRKAQGVSVTGADGTINITGLGFTPSIITFSLFDGSVYMWCATSPAHDSYAGITGKYLLNYQGMSAPQTMASYLGGGSGTITGKCPSGYASKTFIWDAAE
jgi:hypothetical protein